MSEAINKRCPFKIGGCHSDCFLYDAQFKACLVAAALSGIAAWTSMKLVEGVAFDENSLQADLFKAIFEQARKSVKEGMAAKKEATNANG